MFLWVEYITSSSYLDLSNVLGGIFYAIRSLKVSISLAKCNLLKKDSILYIINNAANGTTDITITLHADVYNKCIEGGEWYDDIQTALDNNGHISLISA